MHTSMTSSIWFAAWKSKTIWPNVPTVPGRWQAIAHCVRALAPTLFVTAHQRNFEHPCWKKLEKKVSLSRLSKMDLRKSPTHCLAQVLVLGQTCVSQFGIGPPSPHVSQSPLEPYSSEYIRDASTTCPRRSSPIMSVP